MPADEARTAALARARGARHFLAALDDAGDLIGDALRGSRLPVTEKQCREDLSALQDIADAALTSALHQLDQLDRAVA